MLWKSSVLSLNCIFGLFCSLIVSRLRPSFSSILLFGPFVIQSFHGSLNELNQAGMFKLLQRVKAPEQVRERCGPDITAKVTDKVASISVRFSTRNISFSLPFNHLQLSASFSFGANYSRCSSARILSGVIYYRQHLGCMEPKVSPRGTVVFWSVAASICNSKKERLPW